MTSSSHRSSARASVSAQTAFAFVERAAIAEHVGRLSPRDAELSARREVGLEPPPRVSDVTGGPLSALEAGRTMRGESLRCVGMQTEDGSLCCRLCLDAATARGRSMPEALEGRGFGMFVWHSWRGNGRTGTCVVCGHPVIGEIER